MGRLRNHRHELFAQALADGKSRGEAMIAAGYQLHRGNKNRLAQFPDVIARVDEIRKYNAQIVDLRKTDRGRLLIELARIACADPPLRAANRGRWTRRAGSKTAGSPGHDPSGWRLGKADRDAAAG